MPLSAADEITIEKTPSYFVTEHAAERVHRLSPHTKLLLVLRDPIARAESDYAQSCAKHRTTRSFEQMALRLPPPFSHHANISALKPTTLERMYRKSRINTDWNAIKIGLYARHMRPWLKWFPLQQIHIVSGEGLIYAPAHEIELVQRFLNLPIEVTASNFYFNATKGFPCIIRPAKVASDEYAEEENDAALKLPPPTQTPHCLGDTKGREHPRVHPIVAEKLHAFYAPYNAELTKLTGFQHNSWR